MKKYIFGLIILLTLSFNSLALASSLVCTGVDATNTKFHLKIADSNLNIQYLKNNIPSGSVTNYKINNYYKDSQFETFWAIRRSFVLEHFVHLHFSKNPQRTSYVRFGKSGLNGPDMGLPISVKCNL